MEEKSVNDRIILAHTLLDIYQRKPTDDLYKEIVSICESAISDDTEDADAYNVLGVLNSEKHPEVSEENYMKAISIEPENSLFQANLALLMQKNERYDDAEDRFKKALDLDPGDANTIADLGNLYFVQERYQEALDQYDKAIDFGMTDPDLLGSRGVANYELGNYPEAISDLGYAFDEDSSGSLLFKGRILQHLSNSFSKLGMLNESKIAFFASSYFDQDIGIDYLTELATNQPHSQN